MAKKVKTEYVCNECGGTTIKWAGQCPHCKAWNTLEEFVIKEGIASRYSTDRLTTAAGLSKPLGRFRT